jgi:threonine dehydrogenase-like Zn-dependent dehydrogenase
MCVRGRTNLCLSYHTLGFHRDGGMAEYVTAPMSICVPVGERGLSMDTAALAQPMAIAVHARARGRVREQQVVLILGAGGIGSFLTYACVASGAQVWVADIADDRLALARALGRRDQPLPGMLGTTHWMTPTEARPLFSTTRSLVVVTGSKVTALNVLSAIG